MPFIKFAYNKTVHSTIDISSFEIIFGFNPLTFKELIPLALKQRVGLDYEKKANMVRQLHKGVQV